jgi:hypothetical protein
MQSNKKISGGKGILGGSRKIRSQGKHFIGPQAGGILKQKFRDKSSSSQNIVQPARRTRCPQSHLIVAWEKGIAVNEFIGKL